MALARTLFPWLPVLAVFSATAAPQQVTDGKSYYQSYGPALSADGSRLAFYSATNPTGGNADHNLEVFVHDRSSGQLRQVTDQPGGGLSGGNQTPSLSADGSRLAFQHYSISGSYAYFQTQVYDLNTNALTTLTPLGFAESSVMSRDGRTVAVAVGNVGLRLYDVATQTFTTLLNVAPLGFKMSGDGRRIVYENFSQGVTLYDVATRTSTVISPPGSGYNQRPALSADGKSIVFSATYDPLGQNADRSSEVFRYDIDTRTLVQVTQGHQLDSIDASVSGDGTRLVFSSAADFTGHNADGNFEVFVYDLLAGSFLQMTDTLGVYSGAGTISEDGSTVAYLSSMNLEGRNPFGVYQIFRDQLDPRPPGALPEPASLALVLVALGAMGGLRRRAG